MTIEAKVITHSIGPDFQTAITILAKMPRFIWAEVLTHRVMSRNASSSRAIPVKKLADDIRENPAMPVWWGAHQSGMQARQECNNLVRHPVTGEMLSREDAWRAAARSGTDWAMAFADAGYHKQLASRPQETLGHITAVITSTHWDNFFDLRRHEDAQPEIKVLADVIHEAIDKSTAQFLNYGEWHLPFITDGELSTLASLASLDPQSKDSFLEILKTISAARCARTSYRLHDGTPSTIDKDLALYDSLVGSRPLHASPTEHQLTPDSKSDYVVYSHKTNDDNNVELWDNPELHGNATGFIQFRKVIEKEIYAR